MRERARSERHFARLLGQRFDEFRVAMALIDGGVGGEAIEVALPFHVEDPGAFRAFDDDVEGMIVVRAVGLFERDELFRSRQIEMCRRHVATPIPQIVQVCKRQAGCGWRLVNPVNRWKHYGIR